MQQPPSEWEPHWSPDRMWWWDGTKWIPAANPTPLPPAYMYTAPAPLQPSPLQPSPGLRTFLIVVLALDVAATGFMSLFGLLGSVGSGSEQSSGILLLLVFVALLALAVVALVGVIARAGWARWAALAAGIAVCLTCLGSIIGIPIIVAAARAPLGKPA